MKVTPGTLPDLDSLREERDRERYRKKYRRVFRNTVFSLITVAAIAILVATLVLPVLQIYGTSMTPTLTEGDIVVSVKTKTYQQGDIVSFYYNNKILVKRVIATAGQWVDMDENGVVYVNGKPIDEPYLTETAFGECDLILPYQVPDGYTVEVEKHVNEEQHLIFKINYTKKESVTPTEKKTTNLKKTVKNVLPRTGQNWTLVSGLAGTGMVFLIAGTLRYRKNDEEA